MRLVRSPAPAMRPFVARLWAVDETAGVPHVAARERVLPTGEMHLVVRLSEHPVRLYAGSDARAARSVGLVTVSGMRSTPYLREVGAPVRSVGVQLHPGVSQWLLGAPADELAGRHWALDDLWGSAAARMRERLLDAGSLERQLDLFEALVAAHLPRLHALHPAVALALERLGAGALIGDIVRESGRSHRTFIALFRQAMGLSPKLYCRVRRLQRVIRRVATEPTAAWSDVARAAQQNVAISRRNAS